MNYPVDVTGGGYTSACTELYDANHDLSTVVDSLMSTLWNSGGMAGTDSGGESWAGDYDPAASSLVDGICDLTTATGKVANLVNGSLVNHRGADGGAYLGSGPMAGYGMDDGDSDPEHYAASIGVSAPDSARGGTGGQPGWWHWIASHVEGLVWPDADTGKLRTAGAAWTKAGGSIDLLTWNCESAALEIETEKSPEVPDAAAAIRELKQHTSDLAAACTSMGQACTDYAQHVDDAHSEMEDELASFIEWTVGIEVGGAILGAVTFGIGEGAAQIAEGAEVANAASKVVRILRALLELAKGVAETIGRILTKITEVVGKIGKFVDAQVEKALVKIGEKLGLDSLSAEEKAAYEKYVARRTKAGKEPKSPEEWQRLKNNIKENKANGDAYENAMMKRDGIVDGEGGWSKQVEYETKDGVRRWDYANEADQTAVEVKSGTTPTKEGLVQLDKDEEALRNGWDVTWHLKKDLSQALMQRLQELQAKYPTFHYDFGG